MSDCSQKPITNPVVPVGVFSPDPSGSIQENLGRSSAFLCLYRLFPLGQSTQTPVYIYCALQPASTKATSAVVGVPFLVKGNKAFTNSSLSLNQNIIFWPKLLAKLRFNPLKQASKQTNNKLTKQTQTGDH